MLEFDRTDTGEVATLPEIEQERFVNFRREKNVTDVQVTPETWKTDVVLVYRNRKIVGSLNRQKRCPWDKTQRLRLL